MNKQCKKKTKNCFLIDLATIANVTEDTKSVKIKPQMFNEAQNEPNLETKKMA